MPENVLIPPPPNLFDFATSELSQDAFICWLASWADAAHRPHNEALHATATAFLDRLLEVSKGPKPAEYRSIQVRRQGKGIDVLLVVNGDTAIIIEDKTNTKDHSGQLERYKRAVAQEFSNYRIAAVYFKTGDQCDYRSAEDAGYGCFRRSDFLEILQRGEALGVKNDIFTDFHRYLRGIEQAVQSFMMVPLQQWERPQWKGFFMALKEKLGDGEWATRGHGGGGSLTFRWQRRDNKYLRLHEDELAFCLEVTDDLHQEAQSVEWKRKLMAKNGTAGISITTSRRKLGKRMTVAVLIGNYRQRDDRGLLDLDRTVERLQKAEVLMDAALGVA
jgi:hypothetical protein